VILWLFLLGATLDTALDAIDVYSRQVERGWQNLLLSFVTAITGTLIEMILVAAGAFIYLHSDVFGVPYWLPCIYAIASLAVGDLGGSLMSISARGTL
jgi:hypothetical protein